MRGLEIVVVLWVIFYTYWIIAAFGVKKNVRTQGRLERNGVRLALIAVIILVFRIPGVKEMFVHYRNTHSGPATETVGILLCLLGFGFAIWARLNLGRNWGQPMTLKEGHELVTTGPYKFVRHPIYTGLLMAMLGSTLVTPFWLVASVCVAGYFVYSARTEEGIMMAQFPGAYSEYRKRTKALVPFVW